MGTDARWGMTTGPLPMADADHLHLLHWLSPAFPIGAFAYSQGLEAAISQGQVRDGPSLHGWIAAVLTHGAGRLDAGFIALSRAEDADMTALADLARAMAGSSERLTEMTEQGRAFGAAIAAITGVAQPPLPYALAVGHATRALRVTTEAVILLWLQGLAVQLTSVAVRFVPLGQTEGQRVISGLASLIADLAAISAEMRIEDLSSTTPGADIAAMKHETMDVRIYRT